MANGIPFVKGKDEARVVDAFCALYNYRTEVANEAGELGPNPLTREEFTLSKIKEYIQEVVVGFEGHVAAETARAAAIIKAKEEVVLDSVSAIAVVEEVIRP